MTQTVTETFSSLAKLDPFQPNIGSTERAYRAALNRYDRPLVGDDVSILLETDQVRDCIIVAEKLGRIN